jgi:hypothetical protein
MHLSKILKQLHRGVEESHINMALKTDGPRIETTTQGNRVCPFSRYLRFASGNEFWHIQHLILHAWDMSQITSLYVTWQMTNTFRGARTEESACVRRTHKRAAIQNKAVLWYPHTDWRLLNTTEKTEHIFGVHMWRELLQNCFSNLKLTKFLGTKKTTKM